MSAESVNLVTGIVAQAVSAEPNRQAQVREFINEHVLNHMGSASVWNLPFINIPALDIFKYDWVMLGVAVVVLTGLALMGRARRGGLVPHGTGNLLEAFVLFIRDGICRPYLGNEDGRKLTPLFCTFFFFILTLNLLGLVPLFSAATGNLGVTAGLSLVTFLLMVAGTIYKCGFVRFLKTFIIPGIPWPLQIIMAPLEVVSMLTRIFALTVRLFANMMAGHIVIFALVGLIVLIGYYALPVLAFVVAVFFFEVFVAFLQAYIFTLLSAVFVGQMLNSEH